MCIATGLGRISKQETLLQFLLLQEVDAADEALKPGI
jgi:hypothetical protein